MEERYGGPARKKQAGWRLQNDFIRWITGHTRKDRVSTDKLRREVGMISIGDSLCCRRLEWLGRLTRMGGDRLVSRIWGPSMRGREPEVDPGGCLTSRRLKIWPEEEYIG